MTRTLRSIFACVLACVGVIPFAACQTGGTPGSAGLSGNEMGSEPINDAEANDYKKAVVRCYKTGGTKVVKIMGELRCY